MRDILLLILSGGVGAAVIKLIDNIISKVMEKRMAKKKAEVGAAALADKEEKELIEALAEGVKWLLYDKIRFLGESYICRGEVDFDDRRMLGAMHKVYHSGLSGNGDLDELIDGVYELPLKYRGEKKE